ncbi:hypothetical protein C2L66_29655 [Paraburkholderia caribensis]|nr:hypothetical protein C2L66_29655 [Paraburkholderia caribensis]
MKERTITTTADAADARQVDGRDDNVAAHLRRRRPVFLAVPMQTTCKDIAQGREAPQTVTFTTR